MTVRRTCRIFYDVIILYPELATFYVPNIVLTFQVDWFITCWYTWTFVCQHFGLKLPIFCQIFTF